MRARAIVSILAGLAVAIAIGVGINLLTTDAGSTVAAVASIAALVVSASAAVVASRQAFSARKQLDVQGRDHETRFGVPIVTVTVEPAPPYVIGGVPDQGTDSGRGATIGADDEIRLLHQFRLLEAEARELLARRSGGVRMTIFNLRADLKRMGVWAAEDIENFDRAVKVRNAIVHGDIGSVTTKDAARAADVVERLREKVRLGQARPR